MSPAGPRRFCAATFCYGLIMQTIPCFALVFFQFFGPRPTLPHPLSISWGLLLGLPMGSQFREKLVKFLDNESASGSKSGDNL